MASLIKRVRAAITDAFTSYDELRLMVGEGDWSNLANVQLEKIARPDPQDIVVFNLVQWARKNERLSELLSNCIEANPGHSGLRSVAEEITALKEKPISDIDDVSIDDQRYRSPPAPLTPPEIHRLAISAGALFVLAVEVFAWTMILVDNAWMYWSGTVLTAGVAWSWDILSNRPLLLRVTSLVKRGLTHRVLWPILIVSVLVFAGGTLLVAPVEYLAPDGAPSLQQKDVEIEPGQVRWMMVRPMGRTVSFEVPDAPPIERVLYPWHRNRVWAPPRLIIEPTFDISQISTRETNEKLWWTLDATVTSNGVEKHIIHIRPYRGGPVIISGIAPSFNGSFFPADLSLARPDQVKVYDCVRVWPGDVLTIDITGPSEKHSVVYEARGARAKDLPYQLIQVPE